MHVVRVVDHHIVVTAVLPGQPASAAVTISLGTASSTPGDLSTQRLLRMADDALYASKDAGRNRVTASGTPAVAVHSAAK